jgi:hypothetical protein
LGRSIFIKYLQDRKDRNNKNVFPESYFEKYKKGAKNFTDVLQSKTGTYHLFRTLQNKFNGDIFPVEDKEEKEVAIESLHVVAQFLEGNIHLPSGQLAFWPFYSFDAIPIEFISNLYETFFHYEKEEKKERGGTYYTPHRIVEFLMDEVFPWDGNNTNIRIFDPSCGSGIFLVEAYRRLISRWQQNNPAKKLSANTLKKLLTNNLYGVDSNPEAIKVAAFSLYLTMCDYLEPRHIWNIVEFPRLSEKNLLARDFFDIVENVPFKNKKFGIVIGNPPWESQLSKSASRYLEKKSYPVGDKQIAQAFLWGSSEICEDKGEIALIAPSKGLLFNTSGPNKSFRKKFFSKYEIKTIVNFSALRRILFEKAAGPASAIFYKPIPPEGSKKILYCCPKPFYSPEDSWRFVIEPQDITHIPLEQALNNKYIWKTAMWGSPRDWEVIQKLIQLPTLKDICENRGWVHGEGFIVGGKKAKKEEASWLTNKPLITPQTIQPFCVEEKKLPKLTIKEFYRSGKNIKDIYRGPHLLILQTPKSSRGLVSAVSRNYAVFPGSFVGVSSSPSDESILGAVCVAINSVISLYYAMLTSRKWLVERDELQAEEVMSLPIPSSIFEENTKIPYENLTKLAKELDSNDVLINNISSMYKLTQNEMALIQDTVEYTLDYFLRKRNSDAIKKPTEEMLKRYGQIFCKTLNNTFDRHKNGFKASILTGDMPMIVMHISLESLEQKTMVVVKKATVRLRQAVEYMDNALLDKSPSGIFLYRNVRLYKGKNIYIAKRNQQRFWTKSEAFRDADETYAEIMKSWKGQA